MRRKQHNLKQNRVYSVLRDKEGTSLVLVSIIAILVVTGVVILRITTSTLLASADKQKNQDQAYMIAVSLGDSIDDAIAKGTISDPHVLDEFDDSDNTKNAIPNSGVNVSVTDSQSGMDTYTIVTISSCVADAEYVYKLTYLKSGSTYIRQY